MGVIRRLFIKLAYSQDKIPRLVSLLLRFHAGKRRKPPEFYFARYFIISSGVALTSVVLLLSAGIYTYL